MKAAQKRRKKCWTVNFGAMFAFKVLFLVVITLVLVTDARLIENKENQAKSVEFGKGNEVPSGDEKNNEVFRRKSVKPKSRNNFKIDSHRKYQKIPNWQQGLQVTNHHEHPDGVVYYYQGFECKPIHKPKQDPRPGMKRDCQSSSSTIFYQVSSADKVFPFS